MVSAPLLYSLLRLLPHNAVLFYRLKNTNTCQIIWLCKSMIKIFNYFCVQSVNVLCSRAPTASCERARLQDQDAFLTLMYSCLDTNISSSSNFQMFSVRGSCDPLYDRQLVESFFHSLPHRPSVVSGRCFLTPLIWYQEYNDVWKHPHGSKRHPNISSHEGAHILYPDIFRYFSRKSIW